MKNVIILVCFTIPIQAISQKSQLLTVSVESKSLKSNRLGTDPLRKVLIYLPPSYTSTNKAYPVLYLLHSWGEDHTAWVSSEHTQGFHLKRSLDSLIQAGMAKEMILVAPDCSNHLGGSWYTNSTSGGNWEDFIVDDLIEFVDKTYRTKNTPDFRGIAGHSMGGYGTLRLIMNHPNVFTYAYAMSSVNLSSDVIASLKYPELLKDIENGTPVKEMGLFSKLLLSKSVAFLPSKDPPFYCDYLFNMDEISPKLDSMALNIWTNELLINKIDKSTENLKGLSIAIDHGSKDVLVTQSREFVKTLKEAGITVKYLEYDGGHTDQFRKRMEGYVLPFFSKIFDH